MEDSETAAFSGCQDRQDYRSKVVLRRLLGDYGMILVLLGLCVLFSLLTLKKQMPEGAAAVARARRSRSRASSRSPT